MALCRRFIRGFAAILALSVCADESVTGATAANASTPSLLWSGVKRVGINCLVQSGSIANAATIEGPLCERVRGLAARQSPIPVQLTQPGDPLFIQADAVVLLVHVSVERSVGGRMIAFTIRPHRPSGGNAEIFYGSAPRAIHAASAAGAANLEAGLVAALAEVLPWQQDAQPKARPL